jgi:hypothetical protein
MATLPHPGAARHHRRAFGPHRRRSQEQLAADIAASIQMRLDEGRSWTWSTYGQEDNPAMQALIEKALHQINV